MSQQEREIKINYYLSVLFSCGTNHTYLILCTQVHNDNSGLITTWPGNMWLGGMYVRCMHSALYGTISAIQCINNDVVACYGIASCNDLRMQLSSLG